jgi:hypothetical protein
MGNKWEEDKKRDKRSVADLAKDACSMIATIDRHLELAENADKNGDVSSVARSTLQDIVRCLLSAESMSYELRGNLRAANEPEQNDQAYDTPANQQSNLSKHHEQLCLRALKLYREVGDSIMIEYFTDDREAGLTRHDIYRMENVNQLLCILLAGSLRNVNTAKEINQAIVKDRSISEGLRSKYDNE